MAEFRRIFIAVNLPEEIKRQIYERLSCKIPQEKCKVVGMQNLHITMKFLGYVSDEKLEEIGEKMQIIENETRFNATISGIGDFNARVIWIGIAEGSGEFQRISAMIDDALSLHDERFHAHITLARNKMLKRREVDEVLGRLKAENYSANIKVESIDIMESKLMRSGPEYSVVRRVMLK
ncbi:MAG: RNA 2',3'-cyclic phosphodiesterase [Candidatus Diapherotrites archaeon]|nr:RNA 2',3'-cyclic phosphodiesterase [Candidatus Diapherotrites archaeon]